MNLDYGLWVVLDAKIIGIDVFIKKYEATNKEKKCIYLIINAECLMKDPYEGNKDDQVT